jgi:hypothetical protein
VVRWFGPQTNDATLPMASALPIKTDFGTSGWQLCY